MRVIPRPPATVTEQAARFDALLFLGRWLEAEGYAFTAITPASHGRVFAREPAPVIGLRDIFGWSRPFSPNDLPAAALDALRAADALTTLDDAGRLLLSRLRFATLDGRLFVHSAWPTTARDAVFFGPDTYRFAAFVRREIATVSARVTRLVDVGCGSGAGGIAAARCLGADTRLQLLDINERALAFAAVNAALAGIDEVEIRHSDLLEAAGDGPQLVICNPPYLPDAAGRSYRDGGGLLGTGVALRLVAQCIERLAPGSTLLLYTGAPFVDGRDQLLEALAPLLRRAGFDHRYEEIDPDVFGEELDTPAMAQVERIAAVGLRLDRHP